MACGWARTIATLSRTKLTASQPCESLSSWLRRGWCWEPLSMQTADARCCVSRSEEECSNEPSLVWPAAGSGAHHQVSLSHSFSDPKLTGRGGAGGGAGGGCVYQGGFRCVGNLRWLQEHNVVAVVNTAKDLGSFFRTSSAATKQSDLTLLNGQARVPWNCGLIRIGS